MSSAKAFEKTITRQTLIDELSVSHGARPCTIIAATKPSRFRKTDNPFWDKEEQEWKIRKVARVNGMTNMNYEDAVNRRRGKEHLPATFKAGSRIFGKRVLDANGKNTALIEHNGNHYIEIMNGRSLDMKYVWVETGKELSASEIAELERFRSPKPKTRQHIKDEVQASTYRLDHVHGISINGQGFRTLIL